MKIQTMLVVLCILAPAAAFAHQEAERGSAPPAGAPVRIQTPDLKSVEAVEPRIDYGVRMELAAVPTAPEPMPLPAPPEVSAAMPTLPSSRIEEAIPHQIAADQSQSGASGQEKRRWQHLSSIVAGGVANWAQKSSEATPDARTGIEAGRLRLDPEWAGTAVTPGAPRVPNAAPEKPAGYFTRTFPPRVLAWLGTIPVMIYAAGQGFASGHVKLTFAALIAFNVGGFLLIAARELKKHGVSASELLFDPDYGYLSSFRSKRG